jgi:anaerobic ribonucleoside-triphosphate reductase
MAEYDQAEFDEFIQQQVAKSEKLRQNISRSIEEWQDSGRRAMAQATERLDSQIKAAESHWLAEQKRIAEFLDDVLKNLRGQ